MAKTRQDFFNEGQANAVLMKATNPDDKPLFCNSGSWQAKAYAEGWTEGCKVVRLASQAQDSINHGDVVMPVEYEALSKAKAMKQPATTIRMTQTAKQTATAHIRFLALQAGAEIHAGRSGGKRHLRLNAKAAQLSAKWGL